MLSVCILVKNEAKLLEGLLKTIKDSVDEIVVGDNGSTDNTVELAREYDCKVVDVSDATLDEARNIYLKYATGDWILTIDADERMSPRSLEMLKDYLQNVDERIYAVYLPVFEYCGFGHWATFYLNRLFRNGDHLHYNRSIHGSINRSILERNGKFDWTYAPLHHFDALLGKDRARQKRLRNIESLEEQIKQQPQKPVLYCYLGLEYVALENYSRAEECYKKAVELDPEGDTYAHLFIAQMYSRMEDYEKALSYAKKKIELSKNNLESKPHKKHVHLHYLQNTMALMSNIYFKQNKLDLALEFVRQNIEENPYLPNNYLNAWWITKAMGDVSGSHDLFRKAVELNPVMANEIIHQEAAQPNIYSVQDTVLDAVQYTLKDVLKAGIDLERWECLV